MTDAERYEALAEQHRRLRVAAQRVVDAGSYATQDGEDEPRVYASDLAELRRELAGEPQPHGFSFAALSGS